MKISGAKYAVFNLFEEDGESFTTRAVSGDKGIIKKAIDILGFKIEGKKWERDLVRAEKLKEHTITHLPSISDLAGYAIPKTIISILEKTLQLGEVVLVTIKKSNIDIGDFSLFMAKGVKFSQDNAVKLYTRQLGITIERIRVQAEIIETKEYFKQMFDNNPDASIVTRMRDDQIENVNEGFTVLTGYTRDEAVGKTTIELNLYENYLDRQILIDGLNRNGYFKSVSTVFRKKDGSFFTGLFSSKKIILKGIEHAFSNVRDISERKKMEDDLRLSEEKYRFLTENASDVIWILNLAEGMLKYVSPSVYNLTGLNSEELMLKHLENSMTPESLAFVRDMVRKNIGEFIRYPENPKNYLVEVQQYCKNGETVWVEISAKFRYDSENNIEIVGVSRNIEERKKKEEEILYLSYHDHLTGLYNRRFYEEELLRLDTKRNLPLTIAMCDVNGLKIINDSFGHSAGDDLLKKVSEVLKNSCRADDIISRPGGDEFVIILPKTDATETEQIIKRIHKLLSAEKINLLDISVSFGFETKNSEEENIQEILKKSEECMYKNKLYESASIRSKSIDIVIKTLYEKSNREMLHSKRVSEICEAIAVAMNLEDFAIKKLKLGGYMHDIGKIGIDEIILNKDKKLTTEEYNEMQKHSEIGFRILSSVNEFSEIAEFVLEHHERWDGKGYPKGLAGDKITLQARIIAIADSFDAMTAERTYKEKISTKEAITEIKKCAGEQFDPEIAKIFVEKVLGGNWE